MRELDIIPYRPEFRDRVVELAVSAWTPVFAKTRNEVPCFVYEAFYPQGWEARQTIEVDSLLSNEPENIWLAIQGTELVGFVGVRIHRQDQMGEIYIVAVSPDRQRQGIGRKLMEFAEQHIRASGMKMIMVETIGDAGHEPARRAYEAFGFERWPVARYFKPL
jgi:ribosomal protein S18 acetylase RimI-like enzyme